MKESNTLVDNVANISLRRGVWMNTKGQYMKELNTLADNAKNISITRGMSQDTKRQYMEESNTPTDNETIFLIRLTLLKGDCSPLKTVIGGVGRVLKLL